MHGKGKNREIINFWIKCMLKNGVSENKWII